MSLAAKANAQQEPQGLALADDREAISWAELDKLLNRAVNGLLQLPSVKTRRATVLASNSAETVIAYLSCLHAGVSATPLRSQLTIDEVAIGVPNVGMGEEVKAFVIPRDPAAAPSAEQLIGHRRQALAGYKCPRTADIVDDIGRKSYRQGQQAGRSRAVLAHGQNDRRPVATLPPRARTRQP